LVGGGGALEKAISIINRIPQQSGNKRETLTKQNEEGLQSKNACVLELSTSLTPDQEKNLSKTMRRRSGKKKI